MLEDGRNSARSCNYGGVRYGIGEKRASGFSIKSKETEIVKDGPNLPRYLKHGDLEMLLYGELMTYYALVVAAKI